MKVNKKQTFVFRRCDLLMPFFIYYFKNTYLNVYFGWCVGVFLLQEKKI